MGAALVVAFVVLFAATGLPFAGTPAAGARLASAVTPAKAHAGKSLKRVTWVTDRYPAYNTTVGLRVSTARHARVRVAIHYRRASYLTRARAGMRGRRTLWYFIGAPSPVSGWCWMCGCPGTAGTLVLHLVHTEPGRRPVAITLTYTYTYAVTVTDAFADVAGALADAIPDIYATRGCLVQGERLRQLGLRDERMGQRRQRDVQPAGSEGDRERGR